MTLDRLPDSHSRDQGAGAEPKQGIRGTGLDLPVQEIPGDDTVLRRGLQQVRRQDSERLGGRYQVPAAR